MSFEKITIQRSLPIINGYVQVPDNLKKNKNAVDATTEIENNVNNLNVTPVKLGITGPCRLAGFKHGKQEMLTFPATNAAGGDNNIETLKDSI